MVYFYDCKEKILNKRDGGGYWLRFIQRFVLKFFLLYH